MRAAAFRLARADLLGRPGQTALTAFAIFAAAHRAGRHARAARRARRAVRGRDGADQRRARLRLRRADRRRCRDAREPARGGGRRVQAARERPGAARPARPSTSGWRRCRREIGRPHVTEGRAPASASEVLVERSFAREEDLQVGDTLTLGDTAYAIAGLAVTTQQATYPRWRPGLVVGAGGDLETGAGSASGSTDPEAIEPFVAAARQALARRPRWWSPTGTTCATRSPTRRAPTR